MKRNTKIHKNIDVKAIKKVINYDKAVEKSKYKDINDNLIIKKVKNSLRFI